jgi:hypothetical protein
MKKLLVSLFVFGLPDAYSSTYHGVIEGIRIAAAPSGSTRVSLHTLAMTHCKARGWYSFEYSKTGPRSAWLAALLSARVTNESIGIEGTGECDASGMEGVAEIDLGDTQVSPEAQGASDAHARTNGTDGDKSSSNVKGQVLRLDFNNNGQHLTASVGDQIEITLGVIGPWPYGDPQISSAAVSYRGAKLNGIPNPGGANVCICLRSDLRGRSASNVSNQ